MSQVEHTHLTQQEQLSALHDGQLSSEQALALVRASLGDESMMQQWRSMSAVSYVLREGHQQPSMQPIRSVQVTQAVHATAHIASHATQAASNDSRWKMVAGFASLAAVGSLVWGLLGAGNQGAQNAAVLAGNPAGANNPAVVLVSTPTGQTTSQIAGQEVTMIRNPRLDELLAAHKQFGGVSALQQPAGSLRSVSLPSNRP